MNTIGRVHRIPLHRPWWARAAEAWRAWADERRRRAAERVLWRDLGHLSEQTLRDIGAPEALHPRDHGADLWRLERHVG